jgi:hypothetical protein
MPPHVAKKALSFRHSCRPGLWIGKLVSSTAWMGGRWVRGFWEGAGAAVGEGDVLAEGYSRDGF